ncbi:hypothetical protein KCU89_g27, partial [Aureobasidium melanogenum]
MTGVVSIEAVTIVLIIVAASRSKTTPRIGIVLCCIELCSDVVLVAAIVLKRVGRRPCRNLYLLEVRVEHSICFDQKTIDKLLTILANPAPARSPRSFSIGCAEYNNNENTIQTVPDRFEEPETYLARCAYRVAINITYTAYCLMNGFTLLRHSKTIVICDRSTNCILKWFLIICVALQSRTDDVQNPLSLGRFIANYYVSRLHRYDQYGITIGAFVIPNGWLLYIRKMIDTRKRRFDLIILSYLPRKGECNGSVGADVKWHVNSRILAHATDLSWGIPLRWRGTGSLILVEDSTIEPLDIAYVATVDGSKLKVGACVAYLMALIGGILSWRIDGLADRLAKVSATRSLTRCPRRAVLYNIGTDPRIMYSPANTESQSQPNSQSSQSWSPRASTYSTFFKFASVTPKERTFVPGLGSVDRTHNILVEGNKFETDASASDIDQPLFPPSKRQRLTLSTSSNIIDKSEIMPIQPPRRVASTCGESEELWSHASQCSKDSIEEATAYSDRQGCRHA